MPGGQPYPPAVGAPLVSDLPWREQLFHRPGFENRPAHDEKARRVEDVAAVLKMVPYILGKRPGARFALVDFAGLEEWGHAALRLRISRGRMVM